MFGIGVGFLFIFSMGNTGCKGKILKCLPHFDIDTAPHNFSLSFSSVNKDNSVE